MPLIFCLFLIVLLAPNTQEWLGQYQPALDYYVFRTPITWRTKLWKLLQWQPNPFWSFLSATLAVVAISSFFQENQFIYFKF